MDPIFKPLMTDEEKIRRVIRKEFLKDNGDGTYDYHNSIYLREFNLKSIESLPKIRNLDLDFYGSWNQLTSLNGGPDYVKHIFDCSYNRITSMVGGPISVDYVFDCSHNPLKTLEGMPKYIGWNFLLYGFPRTKDIDWLESEFRKHAGVIKGKICAERGYFRWHYDQKKLEKIKDL